jgi:hypothetical protein
LLGDAKMKKKEANEQRKLRNSDKRGGNALRISEQRFPLVKPRFTTKVVFWPVRSLNLNESVFEP